MNDNSSFANLRFMVKHFKAIAALLGLAFVIAGLWAMMANMGWGWGLAGVVLGALAYFSTKILGELITIVVDTLLPQ